MVGWSWKNWLSRGMRLMITLVAVRGGDEAMGGSIRQGGPALWRDLRRSRAAARDILDHFRVAKPPIDPMQLATALGVDVSPMSAGTVTEPSVDGYLDFNEGAPFIRYNPGKSLTRQRFTVAHEIGHLMLHPLERKYRDVLSNPRQGYEEAQANRFAAQLLMPSAMVRAHAPYLDEIGLAKAFGVSLEAMRYRLRQLGVTEGGWP